MTPDTAALQQAQALLRNARCIAVLTGAGMSAESGIPTFRDAMTGLWSRFDPIELATAQAFLRDPPLVWGWYEWRRMKVLRAQPNAGHLALAAMAEQVPSLTIVTQNVDDLHERARDQIAGARSTPTLASPQNHAIHHLHGSLHTPRCFDCGQPAQFALTQPDEPEGGRRIGPPSCAACGGMIRPGVVWFGESLPDAAWQQAESAFAECDLALVIGTSGLVYPAAGLPALTQRRGRPVIVINPDTSGHDGLATVHVRGTAAAVLPTLIQRR